MTKRHTIKLWKAKGYWIATNSDPAVKRLFGTDSIPTAFTDTMAADEVVSRIQALNPDHIVFVG